MYNLQETMKKRLEVCRGIIGQKTRELSHAPAGFLMVSPSKDGRYYYQQVKEGKTYKKRYLQKNHPLISRLMQKSYDEKVLRSAQAEEKAIAYYLKHIPSQMFESVYDKLPGYRREMVAPIVKPDSIAKAEWEEAPYQRMNGYEGEQRYLTKKKDKVRSKSEALIANTLYDAEIPYRYEAALLLSRERPIYPDFTILDVKTRRVVYWEHFGMMDNPEYCLNALKKICFYEKHGIYPGEQLIMTFESSETGLDIELVNQLIEHYFGEEELGK